MATSGRSELEADVLGWREGPFTFSQISAFNRTPAGREMDVNAELKQWNRTFRKLPRQSQHPRGAPKESGNGKRGSRGGGSRQKSRAATF